MVFRTLFLVVFAMLLVRYGREFGTAAGAHCCAVTSSNSSAPQSVSDLIARSSDDQASPERSGASFSDVLAQLRTMRSDIEKEERRPRASKATPSEDDHD